MVMTTGVGRALVVALWCFLLVAQVEASSGERSFLGHKTHLHLRHRSHLPHGAVSLLAAKGDGAGARDDADKADSADDTDDDDDDDDDTSAGAAGPAAANPPKADDVRVKKAERQAQEAKWALEQNQLQQKMYNEEVEDLENKELHNLEVDQKTKLVANETGTPKLASFLGDMWKDMRKFQVPFYIEHLLSLMVNLGKEEKGLKKRYEAAQENLEQVEQGDAKDAGGDAQAEKVARKKAEAAAKSPKGPDMSDAMFTKESMPSTSPAVMCVILLCAQYFLIYTLLAVVVTIDDFTGGQHKAARAVVSSTTATVTMAPMLAALFVGAQMRAVQLTQGDTSKHNLPQAWVHFSMYSCVCALFGQVVLVLLIPICTDKMTVTSRGDVQASLNKVVAKVITGIRYALMVALYVGFFVVVAGCFLMEGPEDIWGGEQPPVSVALLCTMIFAAVFFLIYAGQACTTTITEFQGENVKSIVLKLDGIFVQAQDSVNMAPMICVLFLAARMRALQIDPKHGHPQSWAEGAFYLCTASVVAKVLSEIILPLADEKCKLREGSAQGQIAWQYSSSKLRIVGTILQYISLLGVYAGVVAVMISVLIIKHPEDPSLTPPVSPAMQCVINLVFQYCLAYFMLFVGSTILQFSDSKIVTTAFATFNLGVSTVMFAPMMAILFIAARFRALQLTKRIDGTIPKGAGPPTWAQECMFIATWSLMIQFVMAISLPWVLGYDDQLNNTDFTYNKPVGTPKYVGIVLDAIKYISMLAMYGGVVGVVVAIFIMTPETLPPYSQVNLIPGVPMPTPPTAQLN